MVKSMILNHGLLTSGCQAVEVLDEREIFIWVVLGLSILLLSQMKIVFDIARFGAPTIIYINVVS